MKLTKNHLKQIIKEELEIILAEQTFEDLPEGPHTIPCSAGCRKEKGKLVSHKPNFKPTIYLGNGFCSGECVESPLEHPRSVSQKCAEEMTPKEIKTMRDLGIPLRRCKTKGRVGRRTPEPTPPPKPKKRKRKRPKRPVVEIEEKNPSFCRGCWDSYIQNLLMRARWAAKREGRLISFDEIWSYIDGTNLTGVPGEFMLNDLRHLQKTHDAMDEESKRNLKKHTLYLFKRYTKLYRLPAVLEEVYSEKQRRWACSNPHELTAAQAREMCGSKKLKKKKRKSKK